LLILVCFNFVSYTLLGRASIKLFGLSEHDSMLVLYLSPTGPIRSLHLYVLFYNGNMPWLVLHRSC